MTITPYPVDWTNEGSFEAPYEEPTNSPDGTWQAEEVFSLEPVQAPVALTVADGAIAISIEGTVPVGGDLDVIGAPNASCQANAPLPSTALCYVEVSDIEIHSDPWVTSDGYLDGYFGAWATVALMGQTLNMANPGGNGLKVWPGASNALQAVADGFITDLGIAAPDHFWFGVGSPYGEPNAVGLWTSEPTPRMVTSPDVPIPGELVIGQSNEEDGEFLHYVATPFDVVLVQSGVSIGHTLDGQALVDWNAEVDIDHPASGSAPTDRTHTAHASLTLGQFTALSCTFTYVGGGSSAPVLIISTVQASGGSAGVLPK